MLDKLVDAPPLDHCHRGNLDPKRSFETVYQGHRHQRIESVFAKRASWIYCVLETQCGHRLPADELDEQFASFCRRRFPQLRSYRLADRGLNCASDRSCCRVLGQIGGPGRDVLCQCFWRQQF